jgi:putative sigma-54 modulation protein
VRAPHSVFHDGDRAGVRMASNLLGQKGMPLHDVTNTNSRRRQPDSLKRAPFAGRRPKSVKREVGRTDASRIPAHIRLAGVDLTSGDRTYIHRKLGMKLGKFATSIERVSVRAEDVNGPRGGIDKACRIKVVLRGLPSVVVEASDASLGAAVDGALTGIERAVRRSLQRRRSRRP